MDPLNIQDTGLTRLEAEKDREASLLRYLSGPLGRCLYHAMRDIMQKEKVEPREQRYTG